MGAPLLGLPKCIYYLYAEAIRMPPGRGRNPAEAIIKRQFFLHKSSSKEE